VGRARRSAARSLGELWGSVEAAREPAGSAGSPLTIRSHTVNARIDRELAHTTLRDRVLQRRQQQPSAADFRIALPPGALVSGFAVERGGSRQSAKCPRRALAAGAQLRGRRARVGGRRWLRGTLPDIASGEELKVAGQYVEWLSPRTQGEGELVQYRYPLVGDGEAPLIGDFVARIDASASAPTAVPPATAPAARAAS
jgi:hypothetical protein